MRENFSALLKARLSILQKRQDLTEQVGSEFYFIDRQGLGARSINRDKDTKDLDDIIETIKNLILKYKNDTEYEGPESWQDRVIKIFADAGYNIIFQRDDNNKKDFVTIIREGANSSIFAYGWYPILQIDYHYDKDDKKVW